MIRAQPGGYRWLVGILLSGIAISPTLSACGNGASAQVVVAVSGARSIQITPGGSGTVMASVDHAVVVERRATVTSIDIVEGAAVTQGQQLLSAYTIGDSGAIGTATNQLRADEKELESVRARDGVGAPTTMALLVKVAQDRQVLTELKSTPLAVTAPAAGHVSGLSVQVGQQVTRTDVVLHVVDDRTLRVTVPVAASYANVIAPGQRGLLTVPRGSGQAYESTVVSVGPSATGLTSQLETIPIVVELPNPGDLVPLGMEAYVRFPIDRLAPVAVNSLAVLGRDQQPFVFVVQDGRIRQQSVVTGISDGRATEIVSGLQPGDDVVISGGQQLSDDELVAITRSDAF